MICGCDRRAHLEQWTTMAAESDKDSASEAMIISALTRCRSRDRDVWIDDSGASQHMMFDRMNVRL